VVKDVPVHLFPLPNSQSSTDPDALLAEMFADILAEVGIESEGLSLDEEQPHFASLLGGLNLSPEAIPIPIPVPDGSSDRIVGPDPETLHALLERGQQRPSLFDSLEPFVSLDSIVGTDAPVGDSISPEGVISLLSEGVSHPLAPDADLSETGPSVNPFIHSTEFGEPTTEDEAVDQQHDLPLVDASAGNPVSTASGEDQATLLLTTPAGESGVIPTVRRSESDGRIPEPNRDRSSDADPGEASLAELDADDGISSAHQETIHSMGRSEPSDVHQTHQGRAGSVPQPSRPSGTTERSALAADEPELSVTETPSSPSMPVTAANAMSSPSEAGSNRGPVNFDHLAAQVVSQAVVVREAESQRFQMLLDPPQLGELRVEMTRSEDGELAVRLSAARPETQALLTHHAEEIQRSLSERGLSLADLDVASREQDGSHHESDPGDGNTETAGRQTGSPNRRTDTGPGAPSTSGEIDFTA
jgi:hypothetical protein